MRAHAVVYITIRLIATREGAIYHEQLGHYHDSESWLVNEIESNITLTKVRQYGKLIMENKQLVLAMYSLSLSSHTNLLTCNYSHSI